jgi:hypothetical protein
MAMAIIVKPPQPFTHLLHLPSLFLAGSIAQGQAEPWQAVVEAALAERELLILNPRRDDWDSSLRQAIDEPAFCEQVNWELDAQEAADRIVMYFDPATTAPITLLELGLFARSSKLLVCCPPGFWRKGNVDLVCLRYGIPQVETLAALIEQIEDLRQNS